ncbi:hypothetical protein K402DRAFT_401949 [Aulographum hederae CBS 113979]|uniref:Uncharacterized protein n=1 Tax=Aulographum hederae CBS 113979 TaxID=1176131 RepID=A0A6G1H8E1_9PEZI|nr:hypothetical protein K402DRAFT_401949 [Aulographum hederae CBS 113979]
MAQKYKKEELLALRHSVSESTVSIDKFGDEDAIKEHVLRPSGSTSFPASKSENLQQPVALQAFSATTLANKKPSPSPSIKRGKAERLLKEHGSPPGVRVTAGGRIVPSELSQLPYPRFANGMMNMNRAMGFMGGRGYPQNNLNTPVDLSKLLPNGFIGYNALGQACQVVDGTALILQIDPTTGAPRPLIMPPNMPPAHPLLASSLPQSQPPAPQINSFTAASDPLAPLQGLLPSMDLANQYDMLQKEYERRNQEIVTHDRLMIINEHLITEDMKAHFVQQRMRMVTDLDKVRKRRDEVKATLSAVQGNSPNGSVSPTLPTPQALSSSQITPLTAFNVNQVPQARFNTMPGQLTGFGTAPNTNLPALNTAVNSFNAANSFLQSNASVNTYAQSNMTAQGMSLPQTDGNGDNLRTPALSDNAAVKKSPHEQRRANRSHAIEIKPPPPETSDKEKESRITSSAFNPCSPNFEPGKPISPMNEFFKPPSPSPIDSPRPADATIQEKLAWCFDGEQSRHSASREQHSDASFSTADFFPQNPQEHSFKMHMFPQAQRFGEAQTSAFSGVSHEITPKRDWAQKSSSGDGNTLSLQNQAKNTPQLSPRNLRTSSWSQELNSQNVLRREHSQTILHTPRVEDSAANIPLPPTMPRAHMDNFLSRVDRPIEPAGLNAQKMKSFMYYKGYDHAHSGKPPVKFNEPEYIEGYCDALKAGATNPSPQMAQTVSPRDQDPTTTPFSASTQHFSPPPPSPADSINNVSFHSQIGLLRHQILANADLSPVGMSSRQSLSPAHANLQENRSGTGSYSNLARMASVSPGGSSNDFGALAREGQKLNTEFGYPLTRQDTRHSVRSNKSFHANTQAGRTPGSGGKPTEVLPGSVKAGREAARPKHTPLIRQYPGNTDTNTSHRTWGSQMHSQMDGAMDELAEMAASMDMNAANATAPASSPGKKSQMSPQKPGSPKTTGSGGSPSKTTSPKKSGSSPSKRLERVTGKIMKSKKPEGQTSGDERVMDKFTRRGHWKKRLQDIRSKENKEIQEYKSNNPEPE